MHNGHLCAASEAADRFGLDEVVFVPTGRPWQKADSAVSDAEDRYAMTLLAVSAHPKFRVSRVDVDRPGATYTVDTLRDLRQHYGQDAALYFITGADTFEQIRTWKALDEVFGLARFLVFNRPGYSLARDRLEIPAHADVTEIEMPGIDVSSTDCRARAAAGRPIWYLTPDDVVRYVERRGLYRDIAST
ncbi:MAG: nicotinate-nucleotide adenylyltransferase [Stackebrandtia sp.]